MASGSIVEDLDVVKDIGPCHLTGLVDALADSLAFQAAEEGFGNGIVFCFGILIIIPSNSIILCVYDLKINL